MGHDDLKLGEFAARQWRARSLPGWCPASVLRNTNDDESSDGFSHLSDVPRRLGALMPPAACGALAGCSTWSDEISSGEETSSGSVNTNRIELTCE